MNEMVLERVDQNRKLLAIMKTRKLHEVLVSHLTPYLTRKDIMLGTMPGLRRQGGQLNQWTDDLTEWSNKSIHDL